MLGIGEPKDTLVQNVSLYRTWEITAEKPINKRAHRILGNCDYIEPEKPKSIILGLKWVVTTNVITSFGHT